MIAWHKTIVVSPLLFLALGCAEDGSEDSTAEDGTEAWATSTTSTSGPTTSTTAGGQGGQGGSGGGDVPLDCNAAPCGGDVVGVWSYSDACSTSPWTVDACPGTDPPVTRRSRYLQYLKGTVTFDAAGIATVEKSIVAGWEFEIPKACLFGFQECENAVQGDGVTCTQEGEDCLCNSIAEGPIETGSDPYVVDGTTMVIGSGAETATLDYCAQGDALKLVHPETAEATFLTRP